MTCRKKVNQYDTWRFVEIGVLFGYNRCQKLLSYVFFIKMEAYGKRRIFMALKVSFQESVQDELLRFAVIIAVYEIGRAHV